MKSVLKKTVRRIKQYSNQKYGNFLDKIENKAEQMNKSYEHALNSLENEDISTGFEYLKIASDLSKELNDEKSQKKIILLYMRTYLMNGEHQKILDTPTTIFDKNKDLESYTEAMIIKGCAHGLLNQFKESEELLFPILETTNEFKKLEILDFLGNIKRVQGESEESKKYLEKCYDIAKRLEIRFYEGKSLATIGRIEKETDIEKGNSKIREALKISQEIGDKDLEDICNGYLSENPYENLLYSMLDDAEEKMKNFELLGAKKLYAKSLQMCEKYPGLQHKYINALNRYIYCLISNHEFEEAEKLIHNLKENDQESITKNSMTGWFYFYKKDYSQAKMYFEKIRKITNQKICIYTIDGLSSITLIEKDYKKTKDNLESLLKIPNLPFKERFQEKLAINELLKGEFLKAKEIYSILHKNKPKNLNWKLKVSILGHDFEKKELKDLYIKAESHLALYQVKEYISCIEDLFNQLSDTNILKYFLKNDLANKKERQGMEHDFSTYITNTIQQSRLYFKERKLSQCITPLKILYEHEIYLDQKDKTKLRNILLELTYCLYHLGLHKEELKYLEILHSQYFEFCDENLKAEVLFRKGLCHKNLKSFDKAEDFFKQVIKSYKNRELQTLLVLAELYFQSTDVISYCETLTKYIDLAISLNQVEKVEVCKKALKIYEPDYFLKLASQEFENENLELAQKYINQVFLYEIPDLKKIIALLISSSILIKTKQIENCEEQLKQCQQLIEKNMVEKQYGHKLTTYFGELYFIMRKFDKSIEYYEKSLLFEKENHGFVYSRLGYLYLFSKNYKKSIFYSDKALNLNIQPKEMLKNMIASSILMKNFKNAKIYIQRSKEDPDKRFYFLIIEEFQNQPKNKIIYEDFEKLIINDLNRGPEIINLLTKIKEQTLGKDLQKIIDVMIERYKD